MIGARKQELGEAAATELAKDGQVCFQQLDVTDVKSVIAAAAAVKQTYGHLDVLVRTDLSLQFLLLLLGCTKAVLCCVVLCCAVDTNQPVLCVKPGMAIKAVLKQAHVSIIMLHSVPHKLFDFCHSFAHSRIDLAHHIENAMCLLLQCRSTMLA